MRARVVGGLYKDTMKTYLLFLLAVVAVATARFKFTEEWELWKKVLNSATLHTIIAAIVIFCMLNRNMQENTHQMKRSSSVT